MAELHLHDDAHETAAPSFVQQEAHLLASRMPRLMLTARQVSRQAQAGLHGRRRAGSGENFWQYRPFYAEESVSRIDWRRSARDDQLYIREREWEAAHTVWIGLDRSRSMGFQSNASTFSKYDKAIILALALADILVQGGERVGLIGLARPTAQRHVIDVFGETLVANSRYDDFSPETSGISPTSDIVLISDFLLPPEDFAALLDRFKNSQKQGLCLAVADPAEETFPFTGRTEFIDPEDGARLTLGRAQNRRDSYKSLYTAHREALIQETSRRGWMMMRHRTDHPAAEALLGIHAQLANR